MLSKLVLSKPQPPLLIDVLEVEVDAVSGDALGAVRKRPKMFAKNINKLSFLFLSKILLKVYRYIYSTFSHR